MLTLVPRHELAMGPLKTRRLILSPLAATDSAALWDAVDSSRSWLQPWLPWVPYQKSIEASVRFIEASAQDWDAGRALRLGIRLGTGGPLLGVVGLEAVVSLHRGCDIGYWLRRDAAGQGIMREAARRCLSFAFWQLGIQRVRVAAATQNHASLRVIAQLGFRFEGIARSAEWCDSRWLDHAIFSLLQHEWPRED